MRGGESRRTGDPGALVYRQRGVAIVAVMWIVAALMVAVSSISYLARGDVRDTRLRLDRARAVAQGDGVIRIALRKMFESKQALDRARRIDIAFADVSAVVDIFPVSGFIDINAAPESLLADLFVHGAGVAPDQATALAERVLDWRDADNQPMPFGAEDPAYEAAGVKFRTRSGNFESPEDLLQVLGFDYEIFDKIKGLVTIYGGAGVSPLAAPEDVLKVLARGDVELAMQISAARYQGEAVIDTSRLVQANLMWGGGSNVVLVQARFNLGGDQIVRRRWVDMSSRVPGKLWTELRAETAFLPPAEGQGR